MWALDPIDGTANFLRGSPLCGISLGLIHRTRPVLGVIDLPRLTTRYTAVEGGGTYANGQRITVSQTKDLHDAAVAIGDYAVGEGSEAKNGVRLALTRRLAARVQRVRMHGSAALDFAWLAHARLDATITLGNKPWDMVAGVTVAREAGALVVDADGSEHTTASRYTIAAVPALVGQVLEVIQQARYDADQTI